VVRTRVGYAGGTSADPAYYNLGGHTETVQVDYDPTKISYDELLNVFWNSHDPTAFAYSRQYQSIIFVHNEEQHRLAIQSKQKEEAKLGSTFTTEIVPFSHFYPAEGWHQKYYLRQIPELMADFKAMYPDAGNFIDSTAAARINGYIGGYGSAETLQKELASYGLSPTGNKTLLEYVSAVPGICSVP
jgi:peptide-methionine (S)-S-oxide reductase